MTNDELDAILSDRYAEWIKVERYQETDNPSWDDFWNLAPHHKAETSFLIAKCKELASALKTSRIVCKQQKVEASANISNMRDFWMRMGRNELEREQRGY